MKIQEKVVQAVIAELDTSLSEIGDPIVSESLLFQSTIDRFFPVPQSKLVIDALHEQGASQVFPTVEVKNRNCSRFNQAKLDEIGELVKMGTFEFVSESDVTRIGSVLHLRLALCIKDRREPN